MDSLNTYLNIRSNSEGSNKMFKILQCICNILEFFSKNPEDRVKYGNISSVISDARKMFKLFKFIHEVPRLRYLIESNLDNFTKNFNILTRAFHLVFYFMENLTIFIKLNFLNKDYRIHIELCMSLSWLLAQIFHLTYFIKTLKKTYTDEEDLRHLNVENYRVNEIYQKLKILSKIRFALILGIAKSLGDFLFACYELKVFENFLGTNFAKLLVGITGIISSYISIYQTYFSDIYTK